VVVEVAYSPPAKKNSTGSSKWPLDPELQVTVQMKAASSSTDDQKVRVTTVGWKCGKMSVRQQLHQPQKSLFPSGKAHDVSFTLVS
jgi:hypothetical protein